MANTQKTLSKAAIAITLCTDRLLKVRDTISGQDTAKVRSELTGCIAHLSDALALTGHANRDLSQKRRDMHRPCLPRELSGICAPHVDMTPELLYGSEFHKSLKEVQESQKLGQNMRGQQKRSTWQHNNSSSFLGRKPWRQGQGGSSLGQANKVFWKKSQKNSHRQ